LGRLGQHPELVLEVAYLGVDAAGKNLPVALGCLELFHLGALGAGGVYGGDAAGQGRACVVGDVAEVERPPDEGRTEFASRATADGAGGGDG